MVVFYNKATNSEPNLITQNSKNMRPFKFFFALSIGIVLFFFIARVLIMAFVLAALMSIPFFIYRKIKRLSRRHRHWHREYDRNEPDFFLFDDEDENDRLILDWEKNYDPWRRARVIQVK